MDSSLPQAALEDSTARVSTGAAGDSGADEDAAEPKVLPDAAMSLPDAGGSTMNATDVGNPQDTVTTSPDPMSPMPLSCGQVFCPLVADPLKACCTTQEDVGRRAARGVGACGVNLSSLSSPDYGTSCWQRDQLGIIDARCPSSAQEPGCCADDGTCGTNNADRQLGCRHVPGSAAQACAQEPPVDMDTCDGVGSYAVRVSVDSMWQSHGNGLFALTDDGRGPIQIYLLANVDKIDPESHRITASGRVCGVTLPPFYSSILCESYRPTFPDSLWESKSLPPPTIEGTYECGLQGCVLSLEPVTYLFGIRLNNPEASWPTPQQTQSLRCPSEPNGQCFADDDADGQPGVLVKLEDAGKVAGIGGSGSSSCRDGYDISSAPLSDVPTAIFDGVRRTDRLMLGIRARVGGLMRFDNKCEAAEGSAIAQYVNSRAKGCMVEPGSSDWLTRTPPAGRNERCTSSEATFIDESMPEYRVLASGEKPPASRFGRDDTASKGPTVRALRFAPRKEPISCAEVRAAKF